ncbi:hypothetical protein BDW02DRAFT_487968 [Decorospora gaudefroyi]|uniref:Transcription factor domain-containing protein n=1 Tax=Decorospora gaudefroyi TaxID=184978 RepID=A0A6A5KKB8_9PLEO|nr:hypothetical protein BDW02DRAFT_487968 [Decorospora gaudefroyi]
MPERDAADVFRRIRTGANAEAVVQQIQEGSLIMELSIVPEPSPRFQFPYIDKIPSTLKQSTYFRSQLYEAIESSEHSPRLTHGRTPLQHSNYAKPLHAAKFVDPLLEDAKASNWTTVSSNDRLMRTLLEGYLVNQYSEHFFFHKEYLLADMASMETRFCSPLLVNALLAKACVSSRLFASHARFWEPDSLLYRFLAEAKRLWELEDGEPRLPTIQAGCLISATMNDFGQDAPGFVYTRKALGMAHRMGLFLAPRTDDTKLEHAKSFTAWGLYTWLTSQSYFCFKPPYMLADDTPAQSLPDVETNPEWYGDISLRYPPDQHSYPTGFGQGMKALSELRVIKNEVNAMCFNASEVPKKMLWEAALLIQTKLEAWYEALPALLQPRSLLYPAHLLLHSEYHSILITLFKSQISSANGSGPPLTHHQHFAAQETILQATIHLESLLRIYYLRHSFEAYDSLLTVFLVHLANLTLEPLEQFEQDPSNVPRDTSESLLSTLILCLKGLYDQSKSAYVAGVLLAILKKRLSAEVHDAVARYTAPDDLDTKSEATFESTVGELQPVPSEFVLPGADLCQDPKPWRLGNLAEQLRRR